MFGIQAPKKYELDQMFKRAEKSLAESSKYFEETVYYYSELVETVSVIGMIIIQYGLESEEISEFEELSTGYNMTARLKEIRHTLKEIKEYYEKAVQNRASINPKDIEGFLLMTWDSAAKVNGIIFNIRGELEQNSNIIKQIINCINTKYDLLNMKVLFTINTNEFKQSKEALSMKKVVFP